MSELDQALIRFHDTGLEYGGGLSNHGPMVAEALHALGHDALIPPFVDVYAPRLPDAEAGAPIPEPARPDALGNGADADWVATFDALVADGDWRALLAAWVPRLAPGLFAAAAHGLLRTAHAVRALDDEETEPRLRELAIGLGYWASRHQPLAGAPGASPRPGCGPAQVLASVEPLPQDERRYGFFTEAVHALEGRAEFAAAIAAFDPDALAPSDAISELCRSVAALYLAHPEFRIAYAHGITAASALRLLAPHLTEDAVRAGVGFAVQAAAALHATHALRTAGEAEPPDAELSRLAASRDEIRYRAACSAEEHAIKLAEACLREDALRPDPTLRLAAADAATRIGASAGGRGG